MSLLVIGLSHRTAALSPAGARRRWTPRPRASSRAGRAAPATHVSEARGPLHLQPGRGLRRRRDLPRRLSPTSARRSPRPPASPLEDLHRAPVRALRGPRRRPPVHRRLRARLDGRRRGPDPRPGARRRCGPPRTPATSAGSLNALLQQALRVGKRAHTETGIDRAGRSLVEAGLDRAERACSARSAGAAVLVVGAGVDERARGRDRCSAPGVGRPHHRQPHARARLTASPPSVGGRAVRSTRWPTPSPRPTSSSPAPAPVGHVDRRADAGDGARRPRAAGRRSSSTWPCRATSTRRSPTCPGVTVVDLEALGRRPRRARQTPPTSRPSRDLVAAEVAALPRRAARPSPSRRPSPRCARARPRSSPPSWPGSSQRLPDLDHARARRGRSTPCTGSSRSCCTRRPCGSRSSPASAGGDAYAAALRELFDLDPERPRVAAG